MQDNVAAVNNEEVINKSQLSIFIFNISVIKIASTVIISYYTAYLTNSKEAIFDYVLMS